MKRLWATIRRCLRERRSRSETASAILAELSLPAHWISSCCISLALLYILELWCCFLEKNAINQVVPGNAAEQGPLFFLLHDRTNTYYVRYPLGLSAVFLTAHILETVMLFMLFLAMRNVASVRGSLTWPILCGLIMAGASLATPISLSPDLYAYVAYGKVGFPHAYAPAHGAFTGDFSIIARWWGWKGTPVVPCVYGPLWLLFAQTAPWFAKTLAGQIFFFRFTNVIALGMLFSAMSWYGVRKDVLALFIAGPTFYGLFVRDGHNDIWPLAFFVLAMRFFRTSMLASFLLSIASVLFKISFIVLVPLACADGTPKKRGALFILAVICASISLSWVLGNRPYLAAMLQHAPGAPPPMLSLTLSIVPIVSVIETFFLERRSFGVTYSFIFLNFATIYYPWYMVWGIPYALPKASYLAAFAILFPIFNFIISPDFHAQIR